MLWLKIAMLLIFLQTALLLVSGQQLIFLDDDNFETLENRQSQQRRGNGRPRQRPRPRPRPRPTPAPQTAPGSTTTAEPARLMQCRQNCIITSEYNPVCGSDGQSYNNINVLRCAQQCGINVQAQRMGLCAPRG